MFKTPFPSFILLLQWLEKSKFTLLLRRDLQKNGCKLRFPERQMTEI